MKTNKFTLNEDELSWFPEGLFPALEASLDDKYGESFRDAWNEIWLGRQKGNWTISFDTLEK